MTAPFLPSHFRPGADPDAPLFSIVTACLNSAATIGATLESVAAQECDDLEHIVVDGGSSDDTCSLVRAAPHGPRLISEGDRGIYDAFNKGLAEARGEFIAFLGSDDTYASPDVTRTIREAAERRPAVDVFHADLDFVDATGRVTREGRLRLRFDPDSPRNAENYTGFRHRTQLLHPTAFVRRRVFARVGGFDTSYTIAGDYDFLLRAYLAGTSFRHLPHVLVRMRDDGVSQRAYWRGRAEGLRAAVRHGTSLREALAELLRFETAEILRRRAPLAYRAARRIKRAVTQP